ncbi:hypothetical protein MHBO_005081 [Bonamia ostreae]|uniref:B30.2/SPRY domain-containing protein n=1 Tax=Bonamia ostreae TaxID=126728 RepID=A0ABV2AVN1_9EUKA
MEILKSGETMNSWEMIVGVVPENFDYKAQKCLGFPSGWGYISGNGSKISSFSEGENFGPKFGVDDKIGIEVDFDKDGSLSFTKNSVFVGVAYKNLEEPIRFAVSFTGRLSSVRINYIISIFQILIFFI